LKTDVNVPTESTGNKQSKLEKKLVFWHLGSRVVDPYSFFTDPDPDTGLDVGGQYGPDPNPDPDPNPIRIQGLNDQKLEKNYN
jgi:hypothetical protein